MTIGIQWAPDTMQNTIPLSTLGPRICILGPSNSGKSTLATAIARKCDLEPVHLDQLFHEPNTDWVPRPATTFSALHEAAIAGERWVMDGNYSKYMPQRFERATGIILLNVHTTTSLLRYLRRTLFERERYGALEGAQDSLKWEMIRHIAVVTPGNHKRYIKLLEQTALPTVSLPSVRAINDIYRQWGLQSRCRD
ncbi:MAG: AAA family ATPase [Advenella sp.]